MKQLFFFHRTNGGDEQWDYIDVHDLPEEEAPIDRHFCGVPAPPQAANGTTGGPADKEMSPLFILRCGGSGQSGRLSRQEIYDYSS